MGSPVSDDRLVNAQNCTQESVREGLKSAAIACVLSAVPTFAAVRTIPWAKANLNYTGQALIISGASIASYFVTADKTILKAAKKNARYERKD
ncbi:early nodulin-93-like isoform X1 [Rhododendron vialii]|uniref:early nodulin-93-like isoform X1 n=1 Tax=Rhododendron vialii TaxID=182163 RepID=UPI00265E36C7|nr:early nodulin-93-like isoform X1 [Rhododendron vialii]